ncbi:MAG: hypothetical protein QXF24_07465 [Thermoproteota archaeon]
MSSQRNPQLRACEIRGLRDGAEEMRGAMSKGQKRGADEEPS